MNLQQIKDAVDSGKTVYWKNSRYEVTKDKMGEYYVLCDRGSSREHCIGLVHQDGITMNGEEEGFFTP